MAKKRRSYNVKNVFISYLVYNERVIVKNIEKIPVKMARWCSKLNLRHIDNRSINASHLFKDKLNLVESGTTILANNSISNFNIFLYCTNQLNVFI